jgi:hypothetical protein
MTSKIEPYRKKEVPWWASLPQETPVAVSIWPNIPPISETLSTPEKRRRSLRLRGETATRITNHLVGELHIDQNTITRNPSTGVLITELTPAQCDQLMEHDDVRLITRAYVELKTVLAHCPRAR